MLNYKYIVFNSNDNNTLKKNPNGYYTICLNDLDGMQDVNVVSQPLDHLPLWIRVIYAAYSSKRIKKFVRLPERIWYPLYFRAEKQTEKPYCFVFMNPWIPKGYYAYLKKKYPDCKIVAVHRDLVKVWKEATPHFIQNPIFDLEYIFDENEASKYGMEYFHEFESRVELGDTSSYPDSDVFFAGKAKDRLPRLLEAYRIFSNHGLKCLFYITGAEKEQQQELPGIIYADKNMNYREMLSYSNNARCLLEINQKQAVGLTSRFLEAVMYNKILITDNVAIEASPFYNPSYIQCVGDVSDIDPKIIDNSDCVDYNYNDEFSPKHLIYQIDAKLSEEGAKNRP